MDAPDRGRGPFHPSRRDQSTESDPRLGRYNKREPAGTEKPIAIRSPIRLPGHHGEKIGNERSEGGGNHVLVGGGASRLNGHAGSDGFWGIEQGGELGHGFGGDRRAQLICSPLGARRESAVSQLVVDAVDPLGLLDEIRAVQHHLAGLAAGATVHPMPQRDADLDGFLRSLALAWRAGEVRPTHRPRKRPPRHWRTRRDPFETTWPRVVQWLEAEPHRTAKELFERLRREHPGMFAPGARGTGITAVQACSRQGARGTALEVTAVQARISAASRRYDLCEARQVTF